MVIDPAAHPVNYLLSYSVHQQLPRLVDGVEIQHGVCLFAWKGGVLIFLWLLLSLYSIVGVDIATAIVDIAICQC
jgi:hypothetical protein